MTLSSMSGRNFPAVYGKLRSMEPKGEIDAEFLSTIPPLKQFFSEKKIFWAHNTTVSSRFAFSMYAAAGNCLDLLTAVENYFSGRPSEKQDRGAVSMVFSLLPILEKTQTTLASLEMMGGMSGPSFFYERVQRDIESGKKEVLYLLKKLRKLA
jgi:hypothetical protein